MIDKNWSDEEHNLVVDCGQHQWKGFDVCVLKGASIGRTSWHLFPNIPRYFPIFAIFFSKKALCFLFAHGTHVFSVDRDPNLNLNLSKERQKEFLTHKKKTVRGIILFGFSIFEHVLSLNTFIPTNIFHFYSLWRPSTFSSLSSCLCAS